MTDANTPRTAVNTDELRRLAEQATPGPWTEGGETTWPKNTTHSIRGSEWKVADVYVDDDAAYIAAASPDVILSLLDERDREYQWVRTQTARVAALEEALRECVQSWDGGLIDKDFDRMSNIFDAARFLLQDKVTP